MEKIKTERWAYKKVKTRGTVMIPGGLRDVLMGSSKQTPDKKK